MGNFRFNTRQLGERVRKALQNHEARAKRAMTEVGLFLTIEAKNRAPVDDGTLVASIANSVENYKESFATVIKVPGNSNSSDYAIAMHEGQYSLGVKSQAKQASSNVTVGRKYITRAIEENFGEIKNIISTNLKV